MHRVKRPSIIIRKESPTAEAGAAGCAALRQISSDFRNVVGQHCERCRGEGRCCLADTVRSLANDTD